jgi:hypothetical protein
MWLTQAYDCDADASVAIKHWLGLSEGNRSRARNVAIKEAQGEWIALLDDDDLWHPNKLVLQLAFAADTGADCIFTDCTLRNANTGVEFHLCPPKRNAQICKGLSIPESFMVWPRAGAGGCSTALIRREVLLALGGFDTNMTLVEDCDMWRRIAQRHRVAFLDETLSTVRTHGVNGENHPVLRLGSSTCNKPISQHVSPRARKTTDRRAVCGRSARPVRREGASKPIDVSYPYIYCEQWFGVCARLQGFPSVATHTAKRFDLTKPRPFGSNLVDGPYGELRRWY